MACIFCPHTILKDRWQHGDLSIEVFRKQIAPYLGGFEWVYLQGWGEPLCHPKLWDMVSLAKEQGCRVGFTTSGNRLNERSIEKILHSNLDMISISFAGASKVTHQALRVNSDWDRLIQSVDCLVRKKHQSKVTAPWVELHFLMMSQNLHELPDFVDLGAKLGADEVVATNLTYTPTGELDGMRAFGEAIPPEKVRLISEAERRAKKVQMSFRHYPLEMNSLITTCSARPDETVFINHQGKVAPCVYLGISLERDMPRRFLGESHPVSPLSFGNLREGLPAVLKGEIRKSFVGAFQKRELRNHPLSTFTYLTGGTLEDIFPSPPEPCQHCYKSYGV